MTTGLTYFFIICATVVIIYSVHEICRLIRQRMLMLGPCKSLKTLKKEVTALQIEMRWIRKYIVRLINDAR